MMMSVPHVSRLTPPGPTVRPPSHDASDDADVTLRLRATTGLAGWDRLESDLGLFAVERIDGRVAVHAGVVVIDGTALLLPGRSHAGKTTLSVALARAGATLASDEYALVDPASGLIEGWGRPARIRLPGGGSTRQPVEDPGPVPVGLVALLRYRSDRTGGADDPSPVEAVTPTRADAVVAVLDETVCARSRPDEALDAALRITEGDILRGERGEAEAAAAWLIERMRTGRTPA